VSGLGYSVVVIDPAAPEGDIFVPVRLEEFSAHEPFDAVVASRSLHHIEELRAATEKIAALSGCEACWCRTNMPWTGSIARPRSGTAATWLRSIPPAPVRSPAASAIGKRTTPGFTATPRCPGELDRHFKERHLRGALTSSASSDGPNSRQRSVV
jgi:hypothetical protein